MDYLNSSAKASKITMLLYQMLKSRAFCDYFKAVSPSRTGVLLWTVDRFSCEWASAECVVHCNLLLGNIVNLSDLPSSPIPVVSAPVDEAFSAINFPEKVRLSYLHSNAGVPGPFQSSGCPW